MRWFFDEIPKGPRVKQLAFLEFFLEISDPKTCLNGMECHLSGDEGIRGGGSSKVCIYIYIEICSNTCLVLISIEVPIWPGFQ